MTEQEKNVLETRKQLSEMIADHADDLEKYAELSSDLEALKSIKKHHLGDISMNAREAIRSVMREFRCAELEPDVLCKMAKKRHVSDKQVLKGTPELEEALKKRVMNDAAYHKYRSISRSAKNVSGKYWDRVWTQINKITALVKGDTYEELTLMFRRFVEDFCSTVINAHVGLPKEVEAMAAEYAAQCIKSEELTLCDPESGEAVKLDPFHVYGTYKRMESEEEAVLTGLFMSRQGKPCAFLMDHLFVWLCGEGCGLSDSCTKFLRKSIGSGLSEYINSDIQPALIHSVKEQLSVKDIRKHLKKNPLYGEYIALGEKEDAIKTKLAIGEDEPVTDEMFARMLECACSGYIDKFRELKSIYDEQKAACEDAEKQFEQTVKEEEEKVFAQGAKFIVKKPAEERKRRKEFLAPYRSKMYRSSSKFKHHCGELSALLAYIVQDTHWVPGEKEIQETVKDIEANLGTGVVYTYFANTSYRWMEEVAVSVGKMRSITTVTDNMDEHAKYILSSHLDRHGDIPAYLSAEMSHWLPQNACWKEMSQYVLLNQNTMLKEYLTGSVAGEFFSAVCSHFPNEKIYDLLAGKRYYGELLRQVREERIAKEKLHHNIVTSVPDAYKDLYPATRTMHRHFVLHCGPTNSGKTYEGIQALIRSKTGVYLAPLRMLAFEKYEELNAAGVVCSLLTGEEEKLNPGATHVSSTIEVADTDAVYDCVVIDECQLITDKQRGGAWTAAILGMQAKEIHLCMSPWAKNTILNIIGDCGDSYEVIEHKRPTELVVESSITMIPNGIRKHDAVITFSRKNVHAISAELERHGLKCSLVYGALPYDVRQNEAKRFLSGETDVVVATDAIGMGMNLPIERVVFAETDKYDGSGVRPLSGEEVRQIAGRAGRQGMYETGYVGSTAHLKAIKHAVETIRSNGDAPMIGFPKTLLGLDQKISELMQEWMRIPPVEGFQKCDLSEPLSLAQSAELYTQDRMLVYKLAMIAFDTKKKYLRNVWKKLAKSVVNGELGNVVIQKPGEHASLNVLEEIYHQLDIYYQFGRVFGQDELKNTASEYKDKVSESIIQILAKEGKEHKKCKRCGRRLPWDTRYTICESCYQASRRYYDYDDYFYDDYF